MGFEVPAGLADEETRPHTCIMELSEQAGSFRYDSRATSVEALREHIEVMGFEVPAGLADEETRSVPHTCLMELSEQAGSFRYDPRATSVEALREHIEDMGNLLPKEIPTDLLIDMGPGAESEVLVAVTGMTCQSCVNTIEDIGSESEVLAAVTGMTCQSCVNTIEDMGPGAESEVLAAVTGMTCQSCVNTIEGEPVRSSIFAVTESERGRVR
ncbi:Uncharacterized protein OBRU01_07999 [Operophtera brumata]|uniref:Uncharacterized protein n=1 Tax=Operophtera brumata TaxID=104452 RepID=A0A0L7L684_OPEBR|nr:Uncharacterized protein OBRU01_07999 [Operophtera brumata]